MERICVADLPRRLFEPTTGHEFDGAGDERKRHILEGSHTGDLSKLASVSILPHGAFASLQQRLASIGTCKTFDKSKLSLGVVCPECGYRPRPSSGPTARALVDGVEDQLTKLKAEWTKTLEDNLSTAEMREQIPLLTPSDRTTVESFVAGGELPSPVGDAFVRALNQVFGRFEVRRVAQREVWSALFPQAAPATAPELRERFDALLNEISKGVAAEKLRILPESEVQE